MNLKTIRLSETKQKCERLELADQGDAVHLKISFQLKKWQKSAKTGKFHEFVIE